MKLSHATLTFISGSIWFAVGVFLMQLGLRLLLDPSLQTGNGITPLQSAIGGWVGSSSQAAILLIVLALGIGFLKGKHVLRKSARRGVERLQTLPNPAPLSQIYSGPYYILLVGMIFLGLSMRFFGIPNDIRGIIDVAIGAALIQGAAEYLRLGLALRHRQQGS